MSSAASISAAKRRRGPQPTFTSQASTRSGQPQRQPQQQQQQRPQGPVRVNPMAILENHELRLREIEGKSTGDAVTDNDGRIESIASDNMEIRRELDSIKGQLGGPGSSSDGRIDALIKENIELKQVLSALQDKIIELSKVKDMVINIQSSVISNAQKVETLKADFESIKTISDTVVAADVAQEIEDVTATMSKATIGYGEKVEQEKSNVTFSVKETGDEASA